MPGNVPFGNVGSLNEVRRELDAKIEKKVSYEVLVILILIITGIVGYGFFEISKLTDKLDELGTKITILETKTADHKK